MVAGRILVVDDDDAIQEFIAASLKDDGYEVMLAQDGRTALEAIKSFRPSLILLDIRMPGMSGEAFLAHYEVIEGYKAPVIALSASIQSREELLMRGASDYLPKPFNLCDLMACIEHWLHARHA